MSEHDAMIILHGVVLGYQCVVMPSKADRDRIYEAMEVYNASLQEREERSKGCEYCNDISPCQEGVLPDGTEQILCSKDGLFGQAYIYARKINFCPMCGRKLKED